MTDIQTEEVWLPVPRTDGFYEVSNFGRMRSIDRLVVRVDGLQKRFRGVLIKPGVMPTGHLSVSMSIKGRRRTSQVHRLVAEAFLGTRPEGFEVRHLDGNPANNLLSNLAYGTRSENRVDRVRHGVDHNARKTHCKWGHEFSVPNTYFRLRGGRTCRSCKARREVERLSRKAARVCSMAGVGVR